MKTLRLFFFLHLFSSISLLTNAQCFSEQTFLTPGETTYTIPGTAGENYLIEIEAKGADGGDFLWGGNPQTNGGEGATMKASFIVPGASNLLVIVGTSGLDAPGSPGGGGGGGGSAVVINNTDVLIAAGAGGGGGQGASNTGQGGQANTDSPPQGGQGLGSSGGGGFNAAGGDGPVSTGGGAGTLFGQGVGGNGGVTAGGGGAGFGGGGGGSGTVGGGGGGYKGGDGSDGSSDLLGKGGDSYVNTLYSGSVIFNTSGVNGGGANINGSVIITCIPMGDVQIMLESALDPQCFGGFGGSIEVSASGGTEPYQYSLNGGVYGDAPFFTGLSEGTYTVTVQDGNGATDMLTVMLTSPSQIVGEIINIIDNVCFGASEGSIEVSASGGTSANGTYQYSINGSAAQDNGLFTNLSDGFYVISIFDDNLCTEQVTASISSPDDLEIIVVGQSDVSCFGADDGSISVEAFGGTGAYMYAINDEPFDSSPNFFDLGGGTHIITVMDEEECMEEVIVFLNEPDDVQFNIETTEITCYNGNDGVISVINLTGTAPFFFKLDDGESTTDSIFTGLTSGEYLLTVIDSAGCVFMDDVELANPDSLILEVDIVMEIQCGGDSTGAVILNLINGVEPINYVLNQNINTDGSFENLPAGTYDASGTDVNGCTTEISFTLEENALFTLVADTVIDVSCFGFFDGALDVGVNGGIEPVQYAINGGEFQDTSYFGNLEAGEYLVQVTDSTACVNEIEITINEPQALSFGHIDVQHIACFGESTGSISISAAGGTPDYIFNDLFPFQDVDTVTMSELEAGDYVLKIVDANGCSVVDTVTVIQNDSLQLFVSNIIPDSCGVDSTGFVDLNAVGGYAPLVISIDGVSDENGEFGNLGAGVYTAVVEDTLGCSVSLEVEILELEGLMIDSMSIGDVTCNGFADGFIDLFISNGDGEVTFFLNGNPVMGNDISGLSGGVYDILAIDEAGCSIEAEIEIFEPNPLIVDLLEVNFDEGCLSVTVEGGTKPYRYSIDGKVTFQDSSKFTDLDFGDYEIIVIDDNGCEESYLFIYDNTSEIEFEALKIYPNPLQKTLFVALDGSVEGMKIEILSNDGRIIRKYASEHLKYNEGVIQVDLGSLNSGSYILKLYNENKISFRQIVVVN